MTTYKFAEVFDGKHDEISRTLNATDSLLNKLHDKKIIRDEHVVQIKIINSIDTYGRADRLRSELEYIDDSLFIAFCRILKDDGQLNVLRIILPEGTDLRAKLIPDTTDTNRQHVNYLTTGCFLETLREDNQCHVINFIKGNGYFDPIKYGDTWPLSEQQRRKLYTNGKVLTEQMTIDDQLMNWLEDKRVLSAIQVKDVRHAVSPSDCITLVLRILTR